MTANPAYISVSGGIAVGKTTLTGELGARLGHAMTFLEVPEHNPYMAKFYEDMPRWNFHSRVFMLTMSAAKYQAIRNERPEPQLVVMDRCFHESVCFARLQSALGNFDDPDYSTFMRLFSLVESLLPLPDIVINLWCEDDVALERIARRGRDFERGVDGPYLRALNEQYAVWFDDLPRKTVVLSYDTSGGLDAAAVTADVVDALNAR
jgi:deoxyadenosine/deoxycytidine kinase